MGGGGHFVALWLSRDGQRENDVRTELELRSRLKNPAQNLDCMSGHGIQVLENKDHVPPSGPDLEPIWTESGPNLEWPKNPSGPVSAATH